MKANEFVKKHGWDEAKGLIAKHEECYLPDVFDMWSDKLQDFVLCTKYASFDISDLKRLVESHELVAIHGFETSKEIVANAPSDDLFYSWTLGGSGVRDKTVNIGELRKAIADVESCMGVSSESSN